MSSIGYDIQSDTYYRFFYNILQKLPVPDFVKSASHEDLAGSESVSEHLYAIPEQRLYPCHTKAATWSSWVYLIRSRDQMPVWQYDSAKRFIEKMAKVHQIANTLPSEEEVIAACADQDKTADTDDVIYALDLPEEGIRKYPLRHKDELHAAIQYLYNHYESLPFRWRQKMAETILSVYEAKFPDADIDEDALLFLEKQAGWGYATSQNVRDLIESRKFIWQGDRRYDQAVQKLEDLCKIASEVQHDQLRDRQVRLQIANIVDELEKSAKFSPFRSGIPRLEDYLFGLTRRQIKSAMSHLVRLNNGSYYSKLSFADLPLHKFTEEAGPLLGMDNKTISTDGLHVNYEKFAQAAVRLDPLEADVLERLLQKWGVHPVYCER